MNKPRLITQTILETAFEETARAEAKAHVALTRSTGLRRCSIFNQYSASDSATLIALEAELGIPVDTLRAAICKTTPGASRRRSDGEEACFELVAYIKRRYTPNERTLLMLRCGHVPWPKISEIMSQPKPLARRRYNDIVDHLWATQKKLIAPVLFWYYNIDMFAAG